MIARLGASGIEILAENKTVAQHTRSLHKGSEDLVLDHYLEVLARKPGALAGATAVVAARGRDVHLEAVTGGKTHLLMLRRDSGTAGAVARKHRAGTTPRGRASASLDACRKSAAHPIKETPS